MRGKIYRWLFSLKKVDRAITGFGGVLIVAHFVGNNLSLIKNAMHVLDPTPPYGLTAYEARLASLRKETPEDAVFGFICDADPSEQMTKYFQTEYVLAPRIIYYTQALSHIIGVFDGPFQAYIVKNHLRIVKDYGQGVMLLEKEQ